MNLNRNLLASCALLVTLLTFFSYQFYKARRKSGKSPDVANVISYRINYEKEAELSYWNTRYLLNCEVQNYINSVAELSNLRAYDLIELTEKYDVDLKFVLAQGAIESHFGTKGVASKTNSVWNVGAYDGLTHDKINGVHKFHHPNQSIEPYLKLLTTKYLVNGKLEADLLKSYVSKDNKRYASDPNYEVRLSSKYMEVKSTTKIDSLYQLLKFYAIKCGRS